MMLVFEEVVKQSISERQDVFPVNVMIELSETDDSIELEASYGGACFDPIKDGDELSASIVKKVSTSVDHSFADGVNRFRSVLRSAK